MHRRDGLLARVVHLVPVQHATPSNQKKHVGSATAFNHNNQERAHLLECLTIARPTELIQSSFSLSESAMKYMLLSVVEISKA
jgi:hypothetical protein